MFCIDGAWGCVYLYSRKTYLDMYLYMSIRIYSAYTCCMFSVYIICLERYLDGVLAVYILYPDRNCLPRAMQDLFCR